MSSPRPKTKALSGPDVLYFDVLPARTALEVGGFTRAATRKRGLALAVTWDASAGFRTFTALRREQLLALIKSSGLLVGYNCRAFDLEIIHVRFPPDRENVCDLFDLVGDSIGRVPFSDAVRTILKARPPSCGIKLMEWWRDGERGRVERALKRKVSLLRRLHGHFEMKIENPAETAHRAMLDRAVEEFRHTGRLPKLRVIRNSGSGACRILNGSPSAEDGMSGEIGGIP